MLSEILFYNLLFLFTFSPVCKSQPGDSPCPFNDQCICSNASGKWSVYCNVSTTFPVFASSDMPISTMLITGQYSVINDNAFFPLTGLTNADITMQSTKNSSTTMITFANTFLTQNPNAISGLYFSGYNPADLYLVPSNSELISLSVQNANLVSVIYSISNFPNLLSIDYSHNRLTVAPAQVFNLSPLRTIWLEYNNFTKVDNGFSTWLQVNPSNFLSMAFNPIPCDSTAQWMANFAVCKPVQIGLQGIYCTNNATLIDYLTPYADACYSTTIEATN